jgi:dihydrofolate synthase/folylpolyglutamate synthase
VVTSISYDHTRQLGNTLAQIAREKAGIIKRGVPVISGVTAPEAQCVIERIAQEQEAPLLQLGRDFSYAHYPAPSDDFVRAAGDTFDFVPPSGTPVWQALPLPLIGEHQAANAAVAVATACELARRGWSLSPATIRQGLGHVSLPARAEILRCQPAIILDTAHNVASIQALAAVVQSRFANKRRHLILAATQDKDVAGMIEVLLKHFDTVGLTRYTSNPRGVPLAELTRLVQHALSKTDSARPRLVVAHEEPDKAWEAALALADPHDVICITGSFFLAAELRPRLCDYASRGSH